MDEAPIRRFVGTVLIQQQPACTLPIIIIMVAGVIELPIPAISSKRGLMRKHNTWLGPAVLLILVGSLRDTKIAPSLEKPWINLLVASKPFAAAGSILLLSAKSLKP